MRSPGRVFQALASLTLLAAALWTPAFKPVYGQTTTLADSLFSDGRVWTGAGMAPLPVLNTTPPWERVWDATHTFFPRIRLADVDGTVWEVVLNPHAVQAIFVAQGRRELEARLRALVPGLDPVWLNLLDFLKSAQIPIRGFIPQNPDALDRETWTANVQDFVRYSPFSDPIMVWTDSTFTTLTTRDADYAPRNAWRGGVEVARDTIEGSPTDTIPGFWVDYVVKVAHSVYKVDGHNPPEDHCIKLSDCTLFCDRTTRR